MLLLDGASPATAALHSTGTPAAAALADTSLTTATFTASTFAAVAAPPSSVALLKHLQLRHVRGSQ